MCGISGIVNGSGHEIIELVAAQQHRGPDNSGYYDKPGVGLGHNRLAILDLSEAGAQPMESARYVLTCNGEIYNYKELKQYLSANDDLGNASDPGNDSATLLAYIEKFGISKALNDINGMFAFGVYDKLEQKIHLCVDRFAQKPLYYTMQPGGVFAFASSPAALLHLKDKWEMNPYALQSYWKLGSVMYDSIWAGIKKVNASEWVTYDITTGEICMQRYWEPTYQSNTNGIEDLILDSIRKVAVSDVPIYIFLSGGVDSTLVASQFRGGNAIHLDGPERQYAEQVAEKFNLNLKIVTPAECDPVTSMRDYCEKSGEPTMAGLIPWITAREATKFCKVAISANGADELFFGYDRTTQDVSGTQARHIFRNLPGEIPVSDIDERLSTGRWLELMTYIQHDLNKTLDFGSMCHSLEVRSPFLDHRLVEMALSMTPEQIGRKEILKRILRGMGFTRSFTDRRKLGFSLYVQPKGLSWFQDEAFTWAVEQGYLPNIVYGKRDTMYLKAAAFGFREWMKTWEGKLA